MASSTVTEGLAELKTLDKRIAKKREFVLTYLLRQEMFKDPLEKDGGSVSAIKREMQSLHDLEERKILIRRAIQQANERNTITVSWHTRSIADWLVWRREVAPLHQQFLANIRAKIELARLEASRKGGNLSNNAVTAKPDDVIVNVNEQELAHEIEDLEDILGTLDGQLSLKNATLLIDV